MRCCAAPLSKAWREVRPAREHGPEGKQPNHLRTRHLLPRQPAKAGHDVFAASTKKDVDADLRRHDDMEATVPQHGALISRRIPKMRVSFAVFPSGSPVISRRMRQFCLVLTMLLGATVPGLAQVTVDLHALDALPGAKPAQKERPVHKTAPKQTAAARAHKSPASATQATPTTTPQITTASPQAATPAPATPAPAAPTPPAATLPAAPPPTIALAPVPLPPAPEPAAAPPPPPISDTATSVAANTGAGLRVTFGAGEADLSPASAAAIKGVVQSAASGESASFNVVAYAAGTPEDPSTARRISLSRALAVRSALMADGVTSSRIYVRALGATGGNEAPDRVDLAILGSNAPDAGAKSPPQ
jgi:outer membrane protein OmpA-like peptidoglycan-associated protein